MGCVCGAVAVLHHDLPKPTRANFILNVETDELFITAGLQDRVVQVRGQTALNPVWTKPVIWTRFIVQSCKVTSKGCLLQVYEGLVYMDFSKQLMDDQGYGRYIT